MIAANERMLDHPAWIPSGVARPAEAGEVVRVRPAVPDRAASLRQIGGVSASDPPDVGGPAAAERTPSSTCRGLPSLDWWLSEMSRRNTGQEWSGLFVSLATVSRP
jgi:hypothetical protein